MIKKQFDVITVGELNVDLILNKIQGFPEVGKEILADNMTLTLGSSSAIFASNLSSLGAKVGFIGKVGKDMFGELVIAELLAKGVDSSLLIKDSALNTGVTVVLNYLEDRANVTYPGAMESLTINDITKDKLKAARHMHFASLYLQEGIRSDIVELFKRAKEAGLTTSLDTQWDPSEKWEFDYKNLLPYVDVFMPNKGELLNLTKSESLDEAIAKIKDFSNTTIIKNGSKGSILVQKDCGIIERPAYLNTNVVDAIGAGDSFNAGFISQFIKGSSLEECQDFGNLTGAINTTEAGGTTAFSSKSEIVRKAKEVFGKEIEL